MGKIYFLYAVLALVFSASSHAQQKIKSTSLIVGKVLQFQKAEWNINITGTFKNPYDQEEVKLDMKLIAPSGKLLLLPCYFERAEYGQSLWKARFTPQEHGVYQYLFQLSEHNQPVDSSITARFQSKKTKGKGILHKKNDWIFQYDNGKPFRGIGENIAWESRDSDDSEFFKTLHEDPKYNYEYMLRSLAGNGGNYFRTWICSWNLPLDWKSGFNNRRYVSSDQYFNPSAIQRLDRLVYLSDSLNLHMMLTLGPGSYNEKNGRYETSAAGFFVDPKAKIQYKNRLRFIVARWGYSPAIGAWEFFNEIDNIKFRDKDNPISTAAIVAWHDEMSTYLKKIDPYEHIVTTSISHRDLEGLNSIADIDLNQKHIYKDTRAISATVLNYSQKFRKPYVIGEYGYEWDWSKNFNDFADKMDDDFKRGLWYGLFSPTPILPMSWWWEFFDSRGTDAYIIRVRTILDQMIRAGGGAFERLEATTSSSEIEIYAVNCGKKTFVYAYNPTSEAIKADIDIIGASSTSKYTEVYDCDSGECNAVKGHRSKDKLPVQNFELAPKKDVVFIWSK